MISVIVPIYNVEAYLHQCVDSIIGQTYTDLEIILVDDGSPDNCGAICDEYAKKDPRVRVIHKPNGGVSDARNVGIENATGDFLFFVDSDDYLDPDAFELMLPVFYKNNLDILGIGSYRVKGNQVQSHSQNENLRLFTREQALHDTFVYDSFTAIWGKIYKKSVIGNIRFPKGRLFEDSATCHLFINNARRIGLWNHCSYYYRKNPSSITQSSFNAKKRYDFVIAYQERLDFVRENNLDYEPECKTFLIKAALSCLTAVYASPDSADNTEIYQKTATIIRENRSPQTYALLSGKYKLFLWCFDRADWIHVWGAKLSLLSKEWKKRMS